MLAGTSLQSQAFALLGAGPIADPANSLFFLWGGANDFFLNPSAATAAAGVTNMVNTVTTLYAGGARNFLVANLPNLAATPAGRALPDPQRAGLQMLTMGFNNGLDAAITGLSGLPSIDITLFDTYAFLNALLADPAAFGISNTTTPWLTGNLAVGGTVCASPGAYLFWDSVHPSAAAHRALGDAFAEAVVPEPASSTLVALAAVAWLAQRRRLASRR